jgi:hypothetical protein
MYLIRVVRRFRGNIWPVCPAYPELSNSAITASSIASDGRHSTRARDRRTDSMSSSPFARAIANVSRSSSFGHVLGQIDQGARHARYPQPVRKRHDVLRMQRGDTVDHHTGRSVGFEPRIDVRVGHGHVDGMEVIGSYEPIVRGGV